MTDYYAFDMGNGKTVIGWMNEEQSKNANEYCLENVVVTETLTCQMTNNTALSLQEDIDIKQQYIEIYNQYAGSIRPELPSFHLYKNNKISSSGLSDKIVQWYLGENIIKEKKKAVQKRFTNY